MTTDWRKELASKCTEQCGDSEAIYCKIRIDDALNLIKRARYHSMEECMQIIDNILDKRWPDTGDRPSSPPAVVLEIADKIMALMAKQ